MIPGTVVAGRFQIERVAGSGGMGTVYRALDRATGRAVALKVLIGQSEEHAARFLREAAVLAELRHPGIVGFIASGTTPDGEPYLVMDWLDGESLSERLKRGPLSVPETVALGRRVADALGFAHARGVIHRDLKPGNLFLPGRDIARPLVLDFGIARVTQPGHTITRTGVALGSPGYMAPEQARGERHLDGRADLFSLGCLLFRCLAGEPPFTGEPLAAMLKAVMDPAPRVSSYRPDIPPALEDLIQALLAKPPDARPRDAAAVEAALGAIMSGAPPSARADAQVWPVTPAPAITAPSSMSAASAPWSAPVSSMPALSVPVASVPVASAPIGGAPLVLRARWLVAGGAAVVLLAGGVAAGVVLFLQEPTAPAGRSTPGSARKSSSPCLATRCQDITYPNPARVEPLEIWDRVMPLVKDIDPTATFTQLVISRTTDGTVSLTPEARAKSDFRSVVFSFVTKTGRALDVAAIPGQLVVQESSGAGKPVPWAVCKPRDAIRAAVGSGAPAGAVVTLRYGASLSGTGGEWTYWVNDRADNYYRRIDGTGCAVTQRGAK